MNSSAFFDALLPPWRATLPPCVSVDYFDAFVARNRPKLEAMLTPLVQMLDAPATRAPVVPETTARPRMRSTKRWPRTDLKGRARRPSPTGRPRPEERAATRSHRCESSGPSSRVWLSPV